VSVSSKTAKRGVGSFSRIRMGGEMLGDHPIEPVLLATDLQASRDFYAEKVGLEIVSESDNAVTFRCGREGRLTVSASTIGTADEQTQAAWRVDDLAAELAELRSRGVKIMEYDTPELRTEDGIVDTGDALHAWIVDPGGNTLGIDQYK
jgi:catechol 2,3-dioxygenase-like lactoylglutathione lyase family enzyme